MYFAGIVILSGLCLTGCGAADTRSDALMTDITDEKEAAVPADDNLEPSGADEKTALQTDDEGAQADGTEARTDNGKMASQEDSKEARADNGETASQAADKEAQVHDEKAQADSAAAVQSQQQSADEQSEEKQILDFVDIFGQSYQAEIDPLVKKQDYKREGFVREGQKLSYQGDERYRFRLGVDVSYHQGTVDWAKVKEAGYDFAFLRIGYRGYGEAGRLCEDTKFYDNFAQARAAGLDVGVYFFSQAVNEREAAEEAEFVLQLLGGIDLQMPVVYDPEKLPGVQTRVDDLSREQFTQNVLTFTRLIRENGYEPMLYSNMLFEAYEYDLTQLSDLDIWYADYEPYPQTPYAFAIWQYTNEGQVDGISGGVDLNIQLLPR